MKRGVGALFLAALFSGLAVVQSQVGVLFVTPDENADVPVSGTVQSDFIDMLEEDDQATVVEVNIGTLDCDSLNGIEGASSLRLSTSPTQTLTAERTSYSVQEGGTLSDGLDRKTWLGQVVDPGSSDATLLSGVTITWTTPCQVETFSMTVNTPDTDGTRAVVQSIPCVVDSDTSTCVVQASLDLPDEGDPVAPEGGGIDGARRSLRSRGAEISAADTKADDIRLLREYLSATDEEKEYFHRQGLRRLDDDAVIMPSGRRLECSSQVDLLVLYTDEVEQAYGSATIAESFIAAQYASSQEAMTNSDIPMTLNVAHVGKFPHDQLTNSEADLLQLMNSEDVGDSRSFYGADLVQLVTNYRTNECGRAFIWTGFPREGFSVTDILCFFQFTHTHELGHNLGALHNREASFGLLTGYSHGHRYCEAGGYRTVMSYPCTDRAQAPRINYFSNPGIDYSDRPTGTATKDNARTLRENMLSVANFESADGCTATAGSCSAAASCCVGTCSDAGICEAIGCNGDPHLVGFRGQKFDFTGEDSFWYSLVYDGPCHQNNIRITAPVPDTPEITYITGVGLTLCDVNGNRHTVEITVRQPHDLETYCPGSSTCLADGALEVTLDGVEMTKPGQVDLGEGVRVAAANIPGPCRSFGFEKYWVSKQHEASGAEDGTRKLIDQEPVVAVSIHDWILADALQTNPVECLEYVDKAVLEGTLLQHQSEHTSLQITSPQLSLRISHGKVHQVAMRDPTDQFDLPDHIAFQMNIGFEDVRLGSDPQGLVGETITPVLDAKGDPIMQGLGAIRGTESDYLVSGPFGADFPQLHAQFDVAGGTLV